MTLYIDSFNSLQLFKKNKHNNETDAVIIVKGKAFLKNKNKPFLIFLFNLNINDKECLIECKKQKYIVNAKIGFKK